LHRHPQVALDIAELHKATQRVRKVDYSSTQGGLQHTMG